MTLKKKSGEQRILQHFLQFYDFFERKAYVAMKVLRQGGKAENQSRINNKTGLQPVSRPAEQILGAKMCSKNCLKN